MTYSEKLDTAIREVLTLELPDSETFFTDTLIGKLITLHELFIFPYIEHEEFQRYIALFRNDIRLDIARCVNISGTCSQEEKCGFLQSVKNHVRAKRKAVDFAFTWYLQKPELLNQVSVIDNPQLKNTEKLKVSSTVLQKLFTHYVKLFPVVS